MSGEAFTPAEPKFEKRQALSIPILLTREDGTATVGALMTDVCRTVAKAVTNEYAKDPGKWEVTIAVVMEKVEK